MRIQQLGDAIYRYIYQESKITKPRGLGAGCNPDIYILDDLCFLSLARLSPCFLVESYYTLNRLI